MAVSKAVGEHKAESSEEEMEGTRPPGERMEGAVKGARSTRVSCSLVAPQTLEGTRGGLRGRGVLLRTAVFAGEPSWSPGAGHTATTEAGRPQFPGLMNKSLRFQTLSSQGNVLNFPSCQPFQWLFGDQHVTGAHVRLSPLN